MPNKSIALLVRDPLKRKRLAFESGYWRFSEYLTSERLLKDGYEVKSLDENSMPFLWNIIKIISRREWMAEYLLSLIQTAKLACVKSPPVAIAWQGPGFVFAAVRKLFGRTNETKLIIIMYYSYPYRTIMHSIIRFVLRNILSDAATVVCVTSIQEKEFAESFRLSSKQLRRLIRGVDVNFFSPDPDPHKRIKSPFVFCPGEFDRDDKLLLAACRDLRLNLVRVTKEPAYAIEISRLAEKMGVSSRVKILSKVEAETLRSLYRDSSFVALPLFNDTHPAGLTSLLEAMSCGKAVIVTKGLTTYDYTEDLIDAVHCQMHNLKDLKMKMALLRDNKELRDTIGINARNAVVKKFRIENDVGGLMNIIKSVTA